MDEFIKLLDSNLDYVSHEIKDNTVYINVVSNRKVVICPHCKWASSKAHSHYKKSFQDLPIQGKKVRVILNNRKMLCVNPNCSHTTFAESFDFIASKAKKTKRLENEILNISMNVSSLTAADLLRNSVVDVGKSTICNLLKKRYGNRR